MKRSRRALLLGSENDEGSTENEKENKKGENLLRKVFQRQNAVSPIFTSPTSGQTMRILQNVTPVQETSMSPINKRVEILEDSILRSSDVANSFSTPKRRRPLVTVNTPSNISDKGASSVAMSRCGSLSDISVSNMVSLNSSFDKEQIFNLLSTPSSEM